MQREIKWKDLNTWLKIGVAGGIIYIAFLAITFIMGFAIGITAI